MPQSAPARIRRLPVRHGIAKTLTLTAEAVDLLEEMSPSTRSYGWFLSELIAAEAARREERARLRREAVVGA